MSAFNSFLKLLGRIALSAIFILAGINKVLDYEGTAAYMASKQMPYVPLMLYAAICIEILGGVMVLVGFKARWGALLLALFLVAVTYTFHDFWSLEGEQYKTQMLHFLSNLAIFGGLIYVVSSGPGAISFDRE